MYICTRTCTHPFTRISWIEIGGTKYAKEDVVVLESNLLPLFGIIIDILYVSEHYYFVCSTLHTISMLMKLVSVPVQTLFLVVILIWLTTMC